MQAAIILLHYHSFDGMDCVIVHTSAAFRLAHRDYVLCVQHFKIFLSISEFLYSTVYIYFRG